MASKKEFLELLLSLNRIGVQKAVATEIKKTSPIHAIETLIVPALETIGEGWESGTVSLSQIYMSGKICEEIVDGIMPEDDPDRKGQPPMAIVVLDDFHQLGKRLVYSALRSSGFSLFNFGHMDVETLVENIKKEQIRILLISVLMFPSALHIKELRKILDQQKYPLKIIVGGAPFRFDEKLWQDVGADAMGKNASDAITLVNRFIEEVK